MIMSAERSERERLLDAEVKGRQAEQLARDAKNLAITAFVVGTLSLTVALIALLWR